MNESKPEYISEDIFIKVEWYNELRFDAKDFDCGEIETMVSMIPLFRWCRRYFDHLSAIYIYIFF